MDNTGIYIYTLEDILGLTMRITTPFCHRNALLEIHQHSAERVVKSSKSKQHPNIIAIGQIAISNSTQKYKISMKFEQSKIARIQSYHNLTMLTMLNLFVSLEDILEQPHWKCRTMDWGSASTKLKPFKP